jgi:hypothetical protein
MRFEIAEILDGMSRFREAIVQASSFVLCGSRRKEWELPGESMREKWTGSNQEMRAFVGVPEDGLAVWERV